MVNYVFVGAEAEGHYSNSYVCEGVFLAKEYYDRHRAELEGLFTCRTFHELDGKHSEVDGDLIIKEFNDIPEMVKFISNNSVSYETYHLTEYLEDETHVEDVEKTFKEIEELVSGYRTYTYSLTSEQNEKVETFIKELMRGRR